jgi:hypothetical protein
VVRPPDIGGIVIQLRPSQPARGIGAAVAAAALVVVANVPARAASASAAASLRIAVPASVTAYASSSTGRHVAYRTTVTGASGAALTVCTKPAGALFALGRTTVGCTVHDGAGHTAKASFVVQVMLRGGPFGAPYDKDGLTQKGSQLQLAFRVFQADGKTPLSDASAKALLAARHVTVGARQAGAKSAASTAVVYDAARHVFTATVQTYDWTGGVDYVVSYRVLGADRSVVATRSVTLGVRLGA